MSESIKDAFFRGKQDTDHAVRRLLEEAGYDNAEIYDMTTIEAVQWLLSLLSPKK